MLNTSNTELSESTFIPASNTELNESTTFIPVRRWWWRERWIDDEDKDWDEEEDKETDEDKLI